MVGPTKSALPQVTAKAFVHKEAKPATERSTNIEVLKENANVVLLDAPNDAYLSSVLDRFGDWQVRGMRGPIMGMEKWQQRLEAGKLSCRTEPDRCGLGNNFTVALPQLAHFYATLERTGGKMTTQEGQLLKDLQSTGLLSRHADGTLTAEPGKFLMAMSRSPEPGEARRSDIFINAYARLLPYIDPDVRSSLQQTWTSLSAADQAHLRSLFVAVGFPATTSADGVQSLVGSYSYVGLSKPRGLAGLYEQADAQCRFAQSQGVAASAACQEVAAWDGAAARALFERLHARVASVMEKKIPDVD